MLRCRLFQGGKCSALGLFAIALACNAGQATAVEKAATSSAVTSATVKPKLGESLSGFSLKDCFGKERKLDEFADKKILVLAFVGVECPLAKLYGPRLEALSNEYASRGVAFVGIDSNRQDTLTELADYGKLHGIKFPLLSDLGNVVADAVGAQRTPEVFVLDEKRVIRYVGRVDDQYGFTTGSGYAKPELTKSELKNALDELLAGKSVSQATTEVPGCLIGRVREPKAGSDITYSNQIARIFATHCVECHRPGQIGPFAMTSYDEVAGWSEMIAEVIRDEKMPPWHADPRWGHFSNDIRLSAEEKKQIATWVANGAPEGNKADLPEPPKFVDGWLMPQKPDVVYDMAKEPFEVPAEGVVEYQYFTVDPGFTEDKWITMAEALPGDRTVVHHIIAFISPPKGHVGDGEGEGGELLVGFAPGTRPSVCLPGMAKKIPAGSKIVFQMHYTPNGKAAKDLSKIGLVFCDDPTKIKQRVITTNAMNALFEIPANDGNFEVKSTKKIRQDSMLLSMFPHMHLRGKSFHYEVIMPDGKKEVVLDVPRYDFNWQYSYLLAEPKLLPKGSKMACVAHYDNSTENPANPDATNPVRWGDQTWEEMMIGWFDIAVPVEHGSSERPMQPAEDKAAQAAPAVEDAAGN